MRLRSRAARPDARQLFANGPISSSTTSAPPSPSTAATPPPRKSRLISPTRTRPREPPPPPPPEKEEEEEVKAVEAEEEEIQKEPMPPTRIPKPHRITVNQVPHVSLTSLTNDTVSVTTPEQPETTKSQRITFAEISKSNNDRPKSWMINERTHRLNDPGPMLLKVESKPNKTKKVLNVSGDSGHVCTIVTVSDDDVHRFQVTNPEPTSIQINGDTPSCDNNNKVTISVGGGSPVYSGGHRNSLVIPVTPEHATTVVVLEEALRDPVQAVKQNLVPHVCGRKEEEKQQEKPKPLQILEPIIQTAQIIDFQDETTESLPEQMDNEMVEIIVENTENLYESIKDIPIYEEIPDTPPPLPLSPPPTSTTSATGRSMFEGASKYDILSYLEDAKDRVIPVEEAYYTASSNDGDDEDGKRLESLELCPHHHHHHHHSDSSDDSCLLVGVEVGGSLISDDADSKSRKGSAEVERNDSGVGSETSKSSRARWQPVRAPSTASSTTSSTGSAASTATVGLEEVSCEETETSSGASVVASAAAAAVAAAAATAPEQLLCEDCDQTVETQVTDSGVVFAPLVCRKCSKRRAERKEIIGEIVETEEKYGRDLEVILEEFYRPMLVAGLLTPDQLAAIFLNVEELLENQSQLLERLRDSLEIAVEQGDEDLLTVDVGKAFLDASQMLHAFESYCTRQMIFTITDQSQALARMAKSKSIVASFVKSENNYGLECNLRNASLLLANLEKEKELLRIFLRVSQMENPVLRRMNLNSFLMVPVQRVTKYPLLLSRLYKVTPAHQHESRQLLREAQHQIELHLEHMNSEAKDLSSTKLWRRISIMNGRRSNSELDMINIRIRKMALELLEWSHDEARFVMEGRLLYTNPTDNNWRRGRTIKLSPISALLVTNGKPNEDYRPPDTLGEALMFPAKQTGVREATLLLVKEKQGRYSLLREPLYLDRCIVCCEADWEDYFEVQELASKDTFIFKAEDGERTKAWYRQIQSYAQGLGAWRRRRNALANIMINGMLTRN